MHQTGGPSEHTNLKGHGTSKWNWSNTADEKWKTVDGKWTLKYSKKSQDYHT